jgi:hypothetical protein
VRRPGDDVDDEDDGPPDGGVGPEPPGHPAGPAEPGPEPDVFVPPPTTGRDAPVPDTAAPAGDRHRIPVTAPSRRGRHMARNRRDTPFGLRRMSPSDRRIGPNGRHHNEPPEEPAP